MNHLYNSVFSRQSSKTLRWKKAPILLLLAFCGSAAIGQTALKYVPSNADMVLSVNLSNLNKKVNLAQLKQYDFFQSLMKEMYQKSDRPSQEQDKAYFEDLINQPSEIGFDIDEPFYLFVKNQGDNTHISLVFKMSNRQKYESRLRQLKADDFQQNLELKDGFQVWQSGDETFAWNDEVIVNVWTIQKPKPYDGGWDTTEYPQDWEDYGEEDISLEEETFDQGMQEEEIENPMPEDIEVIQEEPFLIEQGLTVKDTSAAAWAGMVMQRQFLQPITRNERFMEAVAKPSDIHFWLDYNLFFTEMLKDANMMGGVGGMGSSYDSYMRTMMTFMEVFYADTYFSMGVNFEDGKMAMRNELFFNDDMQRFYQRMLKGKFNKKFLRYVKGGDQMFGYYYMNYNVKNTIEEGKALLYKIFDATPQYGDMARDAMQILGIFIDEDAIGELVKGDLMMSVSGMQSVMVTQKTYEYDADFNLIEKDTTMLQTVPVFTALASYGNEKDVMKFINLGLHSKVLKKEGQYYRASIPDAGTELFLALQNGVLILTNNQYMVTQNLEKGFDKKNRLSKKHRKMLCDNSTVIYWDIPNTIRAVAGDQADTNIGEMGYFNMLGKQFESMEMTYSKKVGNSIQGQWDFNFAKKDKNALQLFFNFINDLFLESEGGAKT